jgi:hypothetical protein
MPEGAEPPPWWVLSVLEPCPAPVEACETWFRFAWKQPPLPFDPRELEQMEREKREREEAEGTAAEAETEAGSD